MQHDRQIDQYKEMQIRMASPQELLLITYDGAIKAMRRGGRLYKKGDALKARFELVRAMSAIANLNATLNVDAAPVVGNSLRALYQYVQRRLGQALLSPDPAPIDEAIQIMASLHATWQEALGARRAESA